MSTKEQIAQLSPVKQALIKIDELQTKIKELEAAQNEPIAVVGMGCRFPGDVNTPAEYWDLLRNGENPLQEAPWQRWGMSGSDDTFLQGAEQMPSARGHYLRDVGLFDPHFFGISPREAAGMDPQQQLLLEVIVEALEHANLPVDGLVESRTGVYIGLMNVDFQKIVQVTDGLDFYAGMGSETSFTAGRLSYLLGLRGPAMTVSTACSSSLVTTHLACQALRANECDLALSGGASLLLMPDTHIMLATMQAISPDGRSKTFDATADGYGRGEGAGVLVLKRLSDAQRDRNRIWALIRGSAINHDGRSGGLTVPSGPAQEAVLRQALTAAQVNAEEISYVEAHGTGTALGDPIEIRALGNAFCQDRQRPLMVGSVKTNVGHLEPSAGVAGLMKVILSLQHQQIPPHLHFHEPNPHIPWDQYPIQIPTTLTDWDTAEPRLAGVSSFGLSGINAHVILEEAPVIATQATDATRSRHLLALSAKSPAALMALAQQYHDGYLTASQDAFGDICYTSHVGRTHYPYRLALVAADAEVAQTKLDSYLQQAELPDVITGKADERAPKMAFLFTGQGAQYVEMGRELYETSSIFRAIIDRCEELLCEEMEESLLAILYPELENQQTTDNRKRKTENGRWKTEDGRRETGDRGQETGGRRRETEDGRQATGDSQLAGALGERNSQLATRHTPHATRHTPHATRHTLDQTTYTQPALFALEYALAMLWQSWGVEPDVVIGHSVGELVAACVAGIFSLEDGLKLIAARGRLMGALPQEGAMVALQAGDSTGSSTKARIEQAIAPFSNEVSIAAINGPNNIVISGQRQAVVAIAETLAAEGVKTRQLAVSHAFHSPLMEPMVDDFAEVAKTIVYHPPRIPIISNVTGKLSTDSLTDWQYWVNHVREPVRFADGVATLHEQNIDIFLEIGPKPTLLGMTQANYDNTTDFVNPVLLPSLREGHSDRQQLLTSLGELYVRGVPVDWAELDHDQQRRKVVLPTYPFQRQRYWSATPQKQRQSGWLRPLIHQMMKVPSHREMIFETAVSVETLPFLADHKVFETIISPGACQLAMVLSAADIAYPSQPCQLTDVVLSQALVVPEEETTTVQVVFKPQQSHEPTNGAVNGLMSSRQNRAMAKTEFNVISFDSTADPDFLEPVTHAMGSVAWLPNPQSDQLPLPAVDLAALRQRCENDQGIDLAAFYANLYQAQIALGPQFQWLSGCWHCTPLSPTNGQTEVLAETLAQIRLPESTLRAAGYALHPGLLDACFQVAGLTHADLEGDEAGTETMLPFIVKQLQLLHQAHENPEETYEWWCHAIQTDSHTWNMELMDSEGTMVALIEGFEVRAVTPDAVQGADAWQDWLYAVNWQPRPCFGWQPDYLPRPVDLAQTLQARILAQSTLVESLPSGSANNDLDQLCLDYILAAFAKVGFTFQVGSQWRTEQIAQQVGVIPHYQRLLYRLLDMLAEGGLLQRQNDGWLVRSVPDVVDPTARICALQSTNDLADEAALTLLLRCGEKLSEVLAGLQDPLELLFPKGDASTVSQLYSESPGTQLTNDLMAQAIQTIVAKLPAEHGLRIIEVGAGTGSTTAVLLPHLPPEQTAYAFTDIGGTFIEVARESFADYDFIDYQLLDIEQSPLEQGFAAQQADIVVAANVLHATKDLGETLTHIRQLLKPGGLLLLVEGTTRSRFIDLTFGLTDGWWRFADLREDHPLLATEQWCDLLLATGFTTVDALPKEEQIVGDATMGQTVLMAQAEPVSVQPRQRWLLFADGTTLSDSVATELRHQGDDVTLVYAGDAYQQIDRQIFAINPTRAEDYHLLFTTLPEIDHVVHLWSLDVPTLAEHSDPLEATWQSCGTVLHLVQALLHTRTTQPQVWLITRGAQAVTAQDGVNGVMQAALWGMGKSLVLEHPELQPIRIDLDAVAVNPALEQAAALCATMRSDRFAAKPEDQVALRDGRQYAARLTQFAPAAISSQNSVQHLPSADHLEQSVTIQPEATYLITGGLRGLGLAVAEWLVAQGAEHLVLLGRSAPSVDIQAQLDEWFAMGIDITVAQVDVTVYEQVAACVAQIDERYPLRGIIHSVGVLDDGVLLQQNWARFTNVLAPKIAGAWYLHRLTQEQPLDFFVLFSSMASLFGSAGQANHAAANAFLDAFAAYRQMQRLPALSINWGAWSETGSATEVAKQMAHDNMGAISTKQGIAAFAHMLEQDISQVGVMPIHWPSYLQAAEELPPFFTEFVDRYLDPATQAAYAGDVQQRIRQQLEVAPAEERWPLLMGHLQEHVATILGMSSHPAAQAGFTELGMDSLMAIELKKRLEITLQTALPATLTFEYPTIEALAAYLWDELALGGSEIEDAEPSEVESSGVDHSDDDLTTLLEDAQTSLQEQVAEPVLAGQADETLAEELVEAQLRKLESLLEE